MTTFVPVGTHYHALFFLVLVVSRGLDLLSTWVGTPNLVLEANPVARRLGWKWGAAVNVGISFVFGFWPLLAIALSTMSILVAARNFQKAWLMRTMGEHAYRDWHVARIQETRITLFLFCLAGDTLLVGAIGIAVICFSEMLIVPLGIGVGMVIYAMLVAFYTMLAVWRLRRAADRETRRCEMAPTGFVEPAVGPK